MALHQKRPRSPTHQISENSKERSLLKYTRSKRAESQGGCQHIRHSPPNEKDAIDLNATGRIGDSQKSRRGPDFSIGSYQVIEKLGQGQFGVVYKAIDPLTGHHVAIKHLKMESTNSQLEKEIAILKDLDHPNIVKYIGILHQSSHVNIILEYVDSGSLANMLSRSGFFPESLASCYIDQVLSGLHYLHSRGIVHRDIKGSNLLITEENVLKLADFGIATFSFMVESGEGEESVTHSVDIESSSLTDLAQGSPFWMDPDVIHLKPASPASDIWSVGCTIIELVTGYPPYFDMSAMAAMFKMAREPHPPLPEKISPNLENFLLTCFRALPDVSQPPTALQLFTHPWILNYRKSSIPNLKSRLSSVASGSSSSNRGSSCSSAAGGDDDDSGDGGGGGGGKLKRVPTLERVAESVRRYNSLLDENPNCPKESLKNIDWSDPDQDMNQVERLLRGTANITDDDETSDTESESDSEIGGKELSRKKKKPKKFDFKNLEVFEKKNVHKGKSTKPYAAKILKQEVKRNFLFSFIVYSIQVVHKKHQWEIYRTYSDFTEFHGKVQKNHSSVPLPDLPPSKFFGNMDPDFVKKRSEDLQLYLEKLLEIEEVFETPLFKYFLTHQKARVEEIVE